MLGCPRSVEVVDRRSSSQNEVIVRDLVAVVQLDFMTRHIDPCNCRHAKRHVVLMPKQASHGRTYVFGVEQRRRNLVKQWLESMVVILLASSHLVRDAV